MIALRVQREPSESGATLGALYINDVFICWTLEDVIREPLYGPLDEISRIAWVKTWKRYGQTAIPAGRYDVVMEFSPKFNMRLPELKGVPGFSESKVHAGNRHQDTEGCILVGTGRTLNTVTNSRAALADVLLRLKPVGNERMFVDLHNPPGRHYGTQLTPEPGSAA